MKKHTTLGPTRHLLIFLFVLVAHTLNAQFFPAKDDTLNFTSILFEFPWVEGVEKYELVAVHESGKGNLSAVSEANKIHLDGLSFGSSYTWKVRGLTAIGEKLPWSTPIPFHIGTNEFVDSDSYRYLGKKLDRSKSERSLLFLDYGKVGINKAGKPSWFLPQGDSLFAKTRVRDLKMTTTGTFTAIFGESAVEFDRQGMILWKAPDDGQVNGEEREHYHHEFTKLPNGNYVVLGQGHLKRQLPNSTEKVLVEFGTVIEYNPKGEVVWSWNSNDYFTDADLFSRKQGERYNTRTHMNACTIHDNEVYVGFRDISRIVVINRKTGKVTESYGGYGVFSEPHSATGFFRRQHDALRLSDGNMAVLNNDSIMDPDVISSVVVFSRMKNGRSNKLLDFKLDFDTLTNGKSPKTGNLNELSNGNILVNWGDVNRFTEITRSGELVWSMFAEQFDIRTQQWKPFPQYRICPAPSLYPYVFTSKLVRNSLKKKQRDIEVKVFNVGTENDIYTVSLLKKGRIIKEKIVEIAPKSNQTIHFQSKRKSAFSVCVKSSKLTDSEQVEIPDFH